MCTAHSQLSEHLAIIIFVGVFTTLWYGLLAVEQKRKNAALSVEYKLLFFTMETRRLSRARLIRTKSLSEHID